METSSTNLYSTLEGERERGTPDNDNGILSLSTPSPFPLVPSSARIPLCTACTRTCKPNLFFFFLEEGTIRSNIYIILLFHTDKYR